MANSCIRFLQNINAVRSWILVVIAFVAPIQLVIEGSIESRCAYVMIAMAVLWLTEALPISVTALMPLFLLPMLGVRNGKDVSSKYVNDTSMLFLGGLIVAVAMEEVNLHKRIAIKITMIMGSRTNTLMLGLMIPTWFLSMWISNTAATSMMVPIIVAVTETMMKLEREQESDSETHYTEQEKKGEVSPSQINLKVEDAVSREKELELKRMSKGFALSVAYAANCGGIATLTGTPPNLVLQGQADERFQDYGFQDAGISFAKWMGFGVPLSIIILILSWLWLQSFFLRCRCFAKTDETRKAAVEQAVRIEWEKLGKITFAEIEVLVLFIILALLWVFRDLPDVGGWGEAFVLADGSNKSTARDSTASILIACLLFILPVRLPNIFCWYKNTDKGDDKCKPSYKPILTWEVAEKKVAWGVIFLLGGGFALADACTGLMFVPYTKRECPTFQRFHHDCNSFYLRDLCVVDVKGVQHKAVCRFCTCEKEAITLLRFGLWAATPEKPRVVFSLDLMELSAALQVECGLSTKSFCEALKFVKRFQIHDVQEVKNLYRVLVGDCSNEYRFHRTIFEKGRHLGLEYMGCPACAQNSTCNTICVDANFGLVHKKSSGDGQGLREVRHADSFFYVQEDVDKFVDASLNPTIKKDCSSFQAGSALRSKVKNSKLDITGVFGAVCKHDFPLKFCNLRYGERLAYAVYFMEKMLKTPSQQPVPIFMYDIACLLHKHLMLNKRDDLLSNYRFAVPVFHSYAHNIKCQLQYGQKNVDNIGLADGEGTERLWSYLRSMSKMTKEMSLDNRHDMLVDCLHHFSTKLRMSLAERVVARYQRAHALKTSAMGYFNKAKEGESTSLEVVKKLHEERKSKSTNKKSADLDPTNAEEYCWLLKQESDIRQKLENQEEPKGPDTELLTDLESIQRKLSKKEKSLGILLADRWSVLDTNKMNLVQSFIRKKVKNITFALKELAVERQTLLISMKRYADGQAIAMRIGKQLQVVNSKINNKLDELNSLSPTKQTFSDVSSPLSPIYRDNDLACFSKEQLHALDTYTSLLRANEEIENSTREMENILKYLKTQGDRITAMMADFQSSNDARSKTSKIFYLMLLKMKLENDMANFNHAFSQYIVSTECDTSVVQYVMQNMGITAFVPAIDPVDLQESLAVIETYENGENDFSSEEEDV